MKELGEMLKAKRKEMGVSLTEASEDLNEDGLLLENLEDGNTKVFKDVFSMKELLIKYSKYLGIDQNVIIDEYNDYIFGHTSKISKEDLKKQIRPKSEKKVVSPYTRDKKTSNLKVFLIIALLLTILLILIFFLLKETIINM